MTKNRKNYILIFCLLAVLGTASFLLKQKGNDLRTESDGLEINYFYSDICHVCAQMKPILEGLVEKYPEVKLNKLSVSSQKTADLFVELSGKHQVPKNKFGRVPAIFIKDRYFVGLDDALIQDLENYIIELIALEQTTATSTAVSSATSSPLSNFVEIPFLGQIDTQKYSLPVLAVMLGFFDGFNVCSLGALVLILGLVLVFRSRKKILVFGGLFILTTAFVYGLLIVFWYYLFALLVPFIKIMEMLIGLLGIAGAIYFLNEYKKYRKYSPNCEIETGNSIINKFSEKMQNAFSSQKGILAIVASILLFSVIITVVEFPCSAAVPLFFASILAEANLSVSNYFLYIAIFILFYMIDEIIVFLIAVLTMTIKLASQKFTTYVALIEAIVLFVLGFYYLFGFLIF